MVIVLFDSNKFQKCINNFTKLCTKSMLFYIYKYDKIIGIDKTEKFLKIKRERKRKEIDEEGATK